MSASQGRLSKNQQKLSIERFGQNIDLDALKLFLSEHEIGSKFETFLALLSDPAYSKLNFSTIARKANISISELQSLYTDGMRHIGLLQMMTQLPQVMSDVAEDAKTSTQPCHRCDSIGFIPFGEETRTCPLCHGATTIPKVGDKHARTLIFETAKLTGQTGPLVAIQQNFQLGDSRMESLLKHTRKIALEPVIEVKNTNE